MIQAHGYPKQYFFAVTNKGVGGLLKRWGDGASMIRGEWKSREANDAMQQGGPEDEDEDDDEGSMGADSHVDSNIGQHPDSSAADTAAATEPAPTNGDSSDSDNSKATVNALTSSLSTLTLVPPSIRFGRGGKNGGFVQQHHSRGAAPKTSTNDGSGRGGRSKGKQAAHASAVQASEDAPAAGTKTEMMMMTTTTTGPHPSDRPPVPFPSGRGMRGGMYRLSRGFRARGRVLSPARRS
jgi:hypothetical protein